MKNRNKINKEIILWKIQIWKNFGFFIPDDRSFYGGDFYVNKKNFNWAKDWDLVKAVEIKSKWKKPEVKIISVKWDSHIENERFEEWIFSLAPEWNWWFVDIISKKDQKWYFIHSTNIWQAKYWDLVKIKIVKRKWKYEWIIVKILKDKFEIKQWVYEKVWDFWFVKIKWEKDVFIARKWDFQAENKQKVSVKIINNSWRRPEWIIIKKED